MIPAAFTPDRLYRAIEKRHSTRLYDGTPVGETALSELAELAASSNPFSDVRAEFVREVPAGFFKGIIGSYYRIDGAPSALALCVSGNDANRYRHLGYFGEMLVLEATARGISSCWVAGSFSREVAQSVVSLGDAEQLVVVVALGHDAQPAREPKRKPLSKIGPGYAEWPTWARNALGAARLAPSAANLQPWRFSLDDRARATVHAEGGLFSRATRPRLDCGIASLHFELGAAVSGVDGVWDERDPDAVVFEPVGAIPVEFSPVEDSFTSARMRGATL